jgi:L-asparagine transporter-like permease
VHAGSVKFASVLLWMVTVPLAVTTLVVYATRWKPGAPGLLPRHVAVISLAYIMLATVAVWASRLAWQQGVTVTGLGLGVVALVIVARKEWSR